MTPEQLADIAARRVFQPRSQFGQLASDHVRFDVLAARPAFEDRALRALTERNAGVAVRGPVGAGKSSLIAAVCAALPQTHIALRVPIVGADDPTSVSIVAAITLSAALSAIDLEREPRQALEAARADAVTRERRPRQLGAKLGGGPVPGEVHAELGSLGEQLATNRLAGERLAGLDRLIGILVARDLEPIFVLEDTEAAVGGRDDADRIEEFFAGPVTAFVQELDAACVIAVQDPLATSAAFQRLAPVLELIDVPQLPHPQRGLAAIAEHRLGLHDISTPVQELLASDALDALVGFYDEANRSLRLTLAALQSAVDHAADLGASCVRAAHVLVGAEEWRSHVDLS